MIFLRIGDWLELKCSSWGRIAEEEIGSVSVVGVRGRWFRKREYVNMSLANQIMGASEVGDQKLFYCYCVLRTLSILFDSSFPHFNSSLGMISGLRPLATSHVIYNSYCLVTGETTKIHVPSKSRDISCFAFKTDLVEYIKLRVSLKIQGGVSQRFGPRYRLHLITW